MQICSAPKRPTLTREYQMKAHQQGNIEIISYGQIITICFPRWQTDSISVHRCQIYVRSTGNNSFLYFRRNSVLFCVRSYVADMQHKKPSHTRITRSSSYTMPLLNRPAHSKATLGDRSFSFASSSEWNSIPNDVRCAPSLSPFKSRLKTFLCCSVCKD